MTISERLIRLPIWLRAVIFSTLFAGGLTAGVAALSGSAVRSIVSFVILFAVMFVIIVATQVHAGVPLTSREDHSAD